MLEKLKINRRSPPIYNQKNKTFVSLSIRIAPLRKFNTTSTMPSPLFIHTGITCSNCARPEAMAHCSCPCSITLCYHSECLMAFFQHQSKVVVVEERFIGTNGEGKRDQESDETPVFHMVYNVLTGEKLIKSKNRTLEIVVNYLIEQTCVQSNEGTLSQIGVRTPGEPKKQSPEKLTEEERRLAMERRNIRFYRITLLQSLKLPQIDDFFWNKNGILRMSEEDSAEVDNLFYDMIFLYNGGDLNIAEELLDISNAERWKPYAGMSFFVPSSFDGYTMKIEIKHILTFVIYKLLLHAADKYQLGNYFQFATGKFPHPMKGNGLGILFASIALSNKHLTNDLITYMRLNEPHQELQANIMFNIALGFGTRTQAFDFKTILPNRRMQYKFFNEHDPSTTFTTAILRPGVILYLLDLITDEHELRAMHLDVPISFKELVKWALQKLEEWISFTWKATMEFKQLLDARLHKIPFVEFSELFKMDTILKRKLSMYFIPFLFFRQMKKAKSLKLGRADSVTFMLALLNEMNNFGQERISVDILHTLFQKFENDILQPYGDTLWPHIQKQMKTIKTETNFLFPELKWRKEKLLALLQKIE